MSFAECGRGWVHDALVLSPQPLCVTVILPQDRAVVTKTCSWRKAGFSYGFLAAGVRGLSEIESFIAIIETCPKSTAEPIVKPVLRTRPQCRKLRKFAGPEC